MNGGARYDTLTVRLHWATAALVLLLWCSAQVIDWFPKGPARWNMRTVHMLLGLALAAVLVWRIRWRWSGGQRLQATGQSTTGRAATAVHLALYALLIGTVLLGLLNAWGRGDPVFGWFRIPALFASDNPWRRAISGWHEWAAHAILLLAGGHAAAALYHHYRLHDGLLQRMRLSGHRP